MLCFSMAGASFIAPARRNRGGLLAYLGEMAGMSDDEVQKTLVIS
jgi:hypothetical protein